MTTKDISVDECCDGEYDYETGVMGHAKGCWGSIEANQERDEEKGL